MERLTLIGLYNYDNSLFDITLPTGIDEDMTVDAILHRGGQFEVIYPEYDFLKASITSWFNRHYRTFDKWITALNIEYDPLNNYDRYEESADNRSYLDNTAENSSSSTSGNTGGSQSSTVSNNVSAFDSSAYQAKDQQISSGTDSSTTSGSTSTNNSRNNSGSDNNTHNAHLYGNIGVTTSQQMLQSELDIAKFNIYDQIAELFIDDFCILVY